MEWQLVVTCVLVGLSSCYILGRGFTLWKARKRTCAGKCGCASSPAGLSGNDVRVAISLDKLKVLPECQREN
jgi:hypothetical protein